MSRQDVAALVGVLLGLLLLAGADRTAREGHVEADGLWDRGFFVGFSPFEAGAGRVASPDSELVVGGLWSKAPVAVTATVASALPRAQVVSVTANGVSGLVRDVGGRFGALRFAARTDDRGALRLRFVGAGAASAVRVARVDVAREGLGAGALPPRRWLLYLGLLIAAAVVSRGAGAGRTTSLAVPLATAVALAWALRTERLLVLDHLPLLLLALLLGFASFAISRLLSMPAAAAAWVAGAFALRALLGLHPAFPGIDLSFHAHNVWRFAAGQAVTSRVASPAGDGSLAIPYPPLLYAMLSPFASSEASAETALRIAMLLLEGSAPWLVLGILSACGASARGAAAAAVTLAVMPEGLLVLAKGIAANILGSWLSLAVLWRIAAGAPAPLLAILMAAAFLAHPGTAVTLTALVLLFVAWEARSGRMERSRAAGLLGAGVAAGGLAWLAYYREVAGVTTGTLGSLASHLRAAPRAFFAFRVVHVAKLAQNLVLKMGGAPLVLAVAGIRDAAGRTRGLLRAWLAVGGFLALLASFTPLAFRFEYFLAPALAMAAGLGADAWERGGRGRWVVALWASSFALQALIGVSLLLGRFELISVIIPSPRWAWPLRLW